MRKLSGLLAVFTVVALLCFGLNACTPLQGSGQGPAGTRLLQMQLSDAVIDTLGNQVSGLQLVAVVVPEAQFSFMTSSIVDPALQRGLFLYVPQNSSPVVLLQSPGGDRSSPGALLGRVLFADGLGLSRSRISAGATDLDLGQPQLLGSRSPYGLEVNEAVNPMLLTDSDADGESDFVDSDDDNDGISDDMDADADGDGIDDAEQGFAALPDSDADGLPDLFSGP